jgi:hypothetical protein
VDAQAFQVADPMVDKIADALDAAIWWRGAERRPLPGHNRQSAWPRHALC